MDLLQQLNLSGVQMAILVTVVAGVTELYGRLIAKDFKTAGRIGVAVITGMLIGLQYGLDVPGGLAAGFVAPGAIAVLSRFGNKSEPTPQTLTGKSLE